MGKRKIVFSNGCFYHIFNRGVEKRIIFIDEEDRFRFIHNLFEFNDINPPPKFIRSPIIGLPEPDSKMKVLREPRKLLVKILCFTLMPNHFHLILEQLVENGIKIFMQKIGMGYANYFNLKYNRIGGLFQGRYRAIQIDNENYLLHLSRYIHINSIELIEPKWKEEGIKDWEKVNKFLENYRWSSYLDYIGQKNFPSVLNQELINSYFETPEEYKKFVNEWIVKDLEKIKNLLLEK